MWLFLSASSSSSVPSLCLLDCVSSRSGTELCRTREARPISLVHHSSHSPQATVRVLKVASESTEEDWELHLGLNSVLWIITALRGHSVANSISTEECLVGLPRVYTGLSIWGSLLKADEGKKQQTLEGWYWETAFSWFPVSFGCVHKGH